MSSISGSSSPSLSTSLCKCKEIEAGVLDKIGHCGCNTKLAQTLIEIAVRLLVGVGSGDEPQGAAVRATSERFHAQLIAARPAGQHNQALVPSNKVQV